jgi:hypothetical protein
MFAMEYWVGRKRGQWMRGYERWPTREAADDARRIRTLGERRSDLTPIERRVVAL